MIRVRVKATRVMRGTHIYIYIYVCVCTYMYIYVHICINMHLRRAGAFYGALKWRHGARDLSLSGLRLGSGKKEFATGGADDWQRQTRLERVGLMLNRRWLMEGAGVMIVRQRLTAAIFNKKIEY